MNDQSRNANVAHHRQRACLCVVIIDIRKAERGRDVARVVLLECANASHSSRVIKLGKQFLFRLNPALQVMEKIPLVEPVAWLPQQIRAGAEID